PGAKRTWIGEVVGGWKPVPVIVTSWWGTLWNSAAAPPCRSVAVTVGAALITKASSRVAALAPRTTLMANVPPGPPDTTSPDPDGWVSLTPVAPPPGGPAGGVHPPRARVPMQMESPGAKLTPRTSTS